MFAALELPAAIRVALAGWRDQTLAGVRGLRPVSADALHVTLCFLGWRATGEIRAIAAACAELSGRPAPRLSLGQARWLPARRPRVLAVELVDGTGVLSDEQALLSRALHAGGWYQPERRPYLPHVTVARVGRDARPPRDRLPPVPSLEFGASHVILFRSRLSHSGARYEALARIELGCAGRR